MLCSKTLLGGRCNVVEYQAFSHDNINPNYTEILDGYKPACKSLYALNHYLLIAKYHIFLARHQSESPSLKVFLVLLESKIRCEREMAIKNSTCRTCEAKWTTLCICDA